MAVALHERASCGSVQAHLDRCALPISDYVTDTRSVLDQAVRVLNAMLDIAAGFGLLHTTLRLLILHQMLVQVRRRAPCLPCRCCGCLT